MNKSVGIALMALTLGGCAGSSQPVTFNTLGDRPWQLYQVDGAAVARHGERLPEIAFSADGRVSGAMCNRFFGQGELVAGRLTVKQLGQTMMLCPEQQLNQWDALIGDQLAKGMSVSRDGQTLTLRGESHTLVYRQQ
ncbi:META domain-containing protein [Pantoea sp. 1.19]|uniref:META domain-containing protein n=1 Tax=Pantoea sp. 1.19 TaxID=1925589 RepID=UPI000948C7D1|nr:META domain-containing protein [Pantoea sp. 1.19]